MDYLEFIKPELLSLILVGYFIGLLKNSEKIQDGLSLSLLGAGV